MKNSATLIRVLFCLGVLILLGFKGQAQTRRPVQNIDLDGGVIPNYAASVGVRLGIQSGLTLRRSTNNGNALEAIVSTNLLHKGVTVTLLYEWNRSAFGARGLLWYYGAGAHAGYYKYNDYYADSHERHDKSGNFVEIGADGIVGIEYAFQTVPLAVSLDAKPYLSFISGTVGGLDGALSIRYTF